MKILLNYGRGQVNVDIPSENLAAVLEGQTEEKDISPAEEKKELEQALDNPLGSAEISEVVRPGQKVVIMASDITRPSPTGKILSVLVPRLRKAGINDRDMKIIFGMGIHRPHTREEQMKLVGEDIFGQIRCADSNKEEYVNIGRTSRGTPLNVCRSLVETDVIICTGNIEYHYFAGYSGGVKAVLPGACDYETIKANHSLQLKEGAFSGNLEGNPVREDIEEISRYLPIPFILNVVLSEKKRVLKAFAGDSIQAHRAGCRYLDTLYGIETPEYADIVIASAGGFPKDINLYQAQKALDNAAQAVKQGGVIILAAQCREGFGENTFAKWINEAVTPDDIVLRLKKEFVLGGHKAAAIARVLQKADVYLVSDMEKKDVEKVFFSYHTTVQEALEQATAQMGQKSRVMVIPQGGSVLPKVVSRYN